MWIKRYVSCKEGGRGRGWVEEFEIYFILLGNVVNGEGNEGVEYIVEWVMYEDVENRVKGIYVVFVIKVGYGGKNWRMNG